MVSKQIGAILVILGGVFYMFGSVLGGFLSTLGLDAALFRDSSYDSLASRSSSAFDVIFVFGLICAILIIAGGALINSDDAGYRKAGGGLSIGMMIIGAVPDVGGLGIGFLFVLIGSVVGLTYKPNVPDVQLGVVQQPPMSPVGSPNDYAGRTNNQLSSGYCINCGKPLHQGARFCKNCGSPVPQ